MDQLKNWPALDIVKFLCVLVMIFVHIHFLLITDGYRIPDTSGFFYKISEKLMSLSLFVMMLPMLAGAVFRTQDDVDLRKTMKLALAISFLGFFMNGLVWGAGYFFSWNVLQFLALSFVVISFFRIYFPLNGIFLLSLGALIFAGPLRNLLTGFDDIYLVAVFIGSDNGYVFWPFFPWFSLVGFGFIFSDFHRRYSNARIFDLLVSALGILLLAAAFIKGEISPSLDPDYVWSPSLFQPETGFVLAIVGLFLVLISLADILFKNIKLDRYGIINSYSKGILWIYIFQMFFGAVITLVVKRLFPMSGPRPAYFIPFLLMIFLSWYVGAMSIRLLQDKKLTITLKKLK